MWAVQILDWAGFDARFKSMEKAAVNSALRRLRTFAELHVQLASMCLHALLDSWIVG